MNIGLDQTIVILSKVIQSNIQVKKIWLISVFDLLSDDSFDYIRPWSFILWMLKSDQLAYFNLLNQCFICIQINDWLLIWYELKTVQLVYLIINWHLYQDWFLQTFRSYLFDYE